MLLWFFHEPRIVSPQRQLNFGDLLQIPQKMITAAGRDLKGRSALHWAATFGHLEASEARRKDLHWTSWALKTLMGSGEV